MQKFYMLKISHAAVDNENNKAVPFQCRPTPLNMNDKNSVKLRGQITSPSVCGCMDQDSDS